VTVPALLLCALALWISTRLVWVRAGFASSLRGPFTQAATGADVHPELGGLALLALAAVAALVATGGWARRIVGVAVAAAGGWAVWLALGWVLGPVPASLGALPAPPVDAVPSGTPVRTAAPVLALAAGFVLVITGVAIWCWARGMPRMGGRYAAPGAAARAPARESEWWDRLDAGDDPTARNAGTDPGPQG
jgi:uncharacterized membrane protein (TIGR02234 family)